MKSSKYEYRAVTTKYNYLPFDVQKRALNSWSRWADKLAGIEWRYVGLAETKEDAKDIILKKIAEDDFIPQVVEL